MAEMNMGALGTLVKARFDVARKALDKLADVAQQANLPAEMLEELARVRMHVEGAAVQFEQLPKELGQLFERPAENPELQHERWWETWGAYEEVSAKNLDAAHQTLRRLVEQMREKARLPRPSDAEVNDAREELKLLLADVPADKLHGKVLELAQRAARDGNMARLWLLTESGFAEAMYEAKGLPADMARHHKHEAKARVADHLPAEVQAATRALNILAGGGIPLEGRQVNAEAALEQAILAHHAAYQSDQALAARTRYQKAAEEAARHRQQQAARPVYS